MATPQVINDILQQAEALFHQGQFAAASQLLSDGIAQAPSAKLSNDWAAVQVSLRQFQPAENLGALLFARGCRAEAAPLLRQSLAGASAQTRPVIEEMLAQCTVSSGQPGPIDASASVSNAGLASPASYDAAAVTARTWDNSLSYDDWCRSVFRQDVPASGVRLATSWADDTEWGLRAYNALAQL